MLCTDLVFCTLLLTRGRYESIKTVTEAPNKQSGQLGGRFALSAL